jgi:hypothetical protein
MFPGIKMPSWLAGLEQLGLKVKTDGYGSKGFERLMCSQAKGFPFIFRSVSLVPFVQDFYSIQQQPNSEGNCYG